MDIFKKAFDWQEARVAQREGWYPFFRPLDKSMGPKAVYKGREIIMCGSNNYLGLTHHPKVKEAAIKAVQDYGSSCSGSRFLNGTLTLHEDMERRLAKFMKRDAALVFSTGFQTNLGTITALVGRGDTVIIDKTDHASIVDGCYLAFGETKRYRHNDMEDLERVLREVKDPERCLVIVDGVFSMEGDLCDLPAIVALKKKYGFRLMVDDAHGLGVLGENGRGTCEHFGLEAEVDLVMGTFSKSFASLGGFITGHDQVIHWIKHHSRALIFSAAIPASNAASVLAVLDIIESGFPPLRDALWKNTRKMQASLKAMGFDTGHTMSPIVPIMVGDMMKTFKFYLGLLEAGVFVNPVIPPAVEPNRTMIRTSYMASHTEPILDEALGIMQAVGREAGVIS
ncbi:MAG: pyridoxal phosphate-dependent aminotransferase family protein [Candidatus Brocadiae bacterium]|nr:pyridoxal phosphate-dependent aminotransferase family protein [Candidatus Brocadiia bacterium]